jgi:hypothetical protein
MIDALVDDCSTAARASNGARWRLLSDRVMGGVSDGTMTHGPVDGRTAWRLQGEVSLRNNGGFLQLALDFDADGRPVDASSYAGLALTLLGDGGRLGVHLRSADLSRPWQSYRAALDCARSWNHYRVAFSDFRAYRTEQPLNLQRLRRIGLIAIGTPGPVDFAVAHLAFYR